MDTENILEEFEKYLQRRFPKRRTSVDYLSDLRQFRSVCQKPWREISMHDMDAFVEQQRAKGLKSATVRRRVAAMKTFFDFLAEESGDLSWPNPVRFKRHAGKVERRLPRDLRDEDLERVWHEIGDVRDRAWFALMVRGGLRVGEVVALKVGDVLNEAEGERPARIRVEGKGRKERVVWLSADAYAVLAELLVARDAGESPCAPVFLNRRGKPLSANGIGWLLHRYGRQAGSDLTPHQLRHTFARQLTEAGMPITSLGKLLGHSQIGTTQIYTAGADPQLAQAYQTAMQRLEQPSRTLLVPPLPHSQPALCAPQPEPALIEAQPQPPAWDSWATHLPEAIRQASLNYVKRCWSAWPAARRRGRALSLLSELKNLWDWFLEHRSISAPGELGLKDLWDYQTDQQDKGYAAGTINRRLDYVLGIARELAERDQPVDQSVFRIRYIPRPEGLPRHLSVEESQHLEDFLLQRLNTPDPLLRLENACLLVLLHSGLRAGECVDLRLQDLDLPGKRLVVRQGKGQRDRLVYLSDSAGLAIQTYLSAQGNPRRQNDLVWLQKNGKPISTGWLRDHVAQVGLAVGIENLFPHRLRHTCATRLLNAGMDITRIQKLLGHETVATTMIYARVQDATVETDYRRFTSQIERQHTPLSKTPIVVADWPTQVVKVQETIDNSV
jgi:site-specific recombinase XerD